MVGEEFMDFPQYVVDGKFVWTQAHADAFDVIKPELSRCLKLRSFDSENPALRTYLITDASTTGMAGYVAQGPLTGTWEDSWPIECYSRAFTSTE